MKILITGTHFTPAQAVIEELKKDSENEIVYVGRSTTLEGDKTVSVESQVIPKLGVKFIPLIAGRLRRNLEIYTLISLLKLPIGFIQAFLIVLKEKPDVVLSFGGYVGFPVVISAWFLSKPILIHEQTLVSGLANIISSYFANKIAVSFETNYSFPKEKVILTGNPIRASLLSNSLPKTSTEVEEVIKKSKLEKKPLILITGGNQGSHIINLVVEKSLSDLLKIGLIVHQTGDSKFKDFDRLSQKKLDNYLVKKWINENDWANLLSKVDLVISRAGINTVSELSFFRIPMILIPLPNLHKNEQLKNAQFFKKTGLVEILLQSELTSAKLIFQVKEILKQADKYKDPKVLMGFLKKDAAKLIVQEVYLLKK